MSDTAPRPNVVLVTCHDLGQHLGCYGADVETPTIDGLAERGVRFENHFCTAPQCSPSRSSITTGRFPHRNGMMGLAHRGWALNDDETAMPEHLADAGYATHLFGFEHVTRPSDPARLGYHHAHTEPQQALAVADRFASTVDALAADEPFFAGVGFTETHRDFGNDRYEPTPPGELELPGFVPENDTLREQLAAMQEDVHAVDDAVERILDALDRAGIADETVVVFTADHGIAFPLAKCTLFDAGLETPLIVRYPDGIDGGRTVEELISNVDLLPTVLELAGADVPADLDGRSFLPLLLGGEYGYVPRDRVFAEQTYHVQPGVSRAIRTDRYKYVRNYLPNVDRPMRRDGDVDRGGDWPEEELYDLSEDPHETTNLAPVATGEDPDGRYAGVLGTLRSELYDWMEHTGDPVVDGHLPLPTRELPDRERRRP